MYSQSYSLVGETLDNRLLNSYRIGVSDAEELSVDTAKQLLSVFTEYHFSPQQITDKFTVLTETAKQLNTVYKKLYRYSYANNTKVCVTRESVSEHMTWKSHSDYLAEIYDRIFAILQNADQYDIDTAVLRTRLERLAENLFIYVNITRTSFLTKFTIKTEQSPSITFVELPEELHASAYPIWYIANSLGVLPSLEKSIDESFTPPTELPDAFFSLTQPEQHILKQGADYYNRLTELPLQISTRTQKTPTELFTTALQDDSQTTYTLSKSLISAYQQQLKQSTPVQNSIAD